MINMDTKLCEKCGEECWRDEADVGVGVIYGPWACGVCGWSENEYYDRSNGPSAAQKEHPDHYVDPHGRMTPLSGIAEKLDHFGLPGDDIIKKFFMTYRDESGESSP
jgi:hypothetical protein